MSQLSKWKKADHRALTIAPPNSVVQQRTTLAAIESLAIPLVQEVVFLADFRCSRCQQRVAEIMSRMNGETQSVVISVLEKKVTLTCTYDQDAKRPPLGQQITPVYQNPWSKGSLILRLIRASCT